MTKTKSRHGLDMLAEVPDLRKPRQSHSIVR